MSTSFKGWIGVDLDGTLARYDGWKGNEHIGDPVPAMLDRVKNWLKSGQNVKIFTARVSPQACRLNGNTLEETRRPIEAWLIRHLGRPLEITHEKDMAMIELWDDRAVSVELNTGRAYSMKRMLPFILYIIGSLFFLASSVISLLQLK